MSTYKVIYFDFHARAEAIRFLLTYGGVEFEDFRFTEEEWPQYKPSMPFGKVPVLEIDGVKYSHTLAICSYLGKKFNLAGSNDLDALQIQAIASFIYDLIDIAEDVTYIYKTVFDEKTFNEQFKKLTEETIPTYFAKFDALVAENGGYLYGGKLSWADLYFATIAELLGGLFKWMGIKYDGDVLEKFENLKNLYEKVRNIDSIKKWIENRPDAIC